MARLREDYRALSGLEKAALLLMSVGAENAVSLFSYMDEEEIRELSQSMANLGNISPKIVERLLIEFADRISSTGALVGNVDSTERLLSKVLEPDRVAGIMEEIRGPAGRTMWDKLCNVNENVLASYLKNEYPQTVAVILTKMKPAHASQVLSVLPEPFAQECIVRMLRMEAVQKDVMDDVERTLRNEFMSNLAQTNRRDAHEVMAEIFNHLDRTVEARFMSGLEEQSRDSAERIRALMFTFEDLTKLDSSGVQTLLRAVDKEKVALALKGGSETVRELFLSNMSTRAAKIMREDMQAMGPVRLRDVDAAQMSLVETAKELAAKNEIVIAGAKDEDELIY